MSYKVIFLSFKMIVRNFDTQKSKKLKSTVYTIIINYFDIKLKKVNP